MTTPDHQRGEYAEDLTGFEGRLLAGLRQLPDQEPARKPSWLRERWRPMVALTATAAAILAAVVVPPMLRAPETPRADAVLMSLAQAAQSQGASAPKPYSYVKAVHGYQYVSLEGNGELTVDIRADQEAWLSNGPADKRTIRVRSLPYQQASCAGTVSDRPCAGWLTRQSDEYQRVIDETYTDVPFPFDPENSENLPHTLLSLLPDRLVRDPQVLANLPVDRAALDTKVTELTLDWRERVSKGRFHDEGNIDSLKWLVLLEILGKPVVSPQVRSVAFQLAAALPMTKEVDESATDRLGRPGVKLSTGTGHDPAGGGGTEVIFDPRTGALLSVESLMPVPPDTRRPQLPLVRSEYTLYLTTTNVDSLTTTP